MKSAQLWTTALAFLAVLSDAKPFSGSHLTSLISTPSRLQPSSSLPTRNATSFPYNATQSGTNLTSASVILNGTRVSNSTTTIRDLKIPATRHGVSSSFAYASTVLPPQSQASALPPKFSPPARRRRIIGDVAPNAAAPKRNSIPQSRNSTNEPPVPSAFPTILSKVASAFAGISSVMPLSSSLPPVLRRRDRIIQNGVPDVYTSVSTNASAPVHTIFEQVSGLPSIKPSQRRK